MTYRSAWEFLQNPSYPRHIRLPHEHLLYCPIPFSFLLHPSSDRLRLRFVFYSIPFHTIPQCYILYSSFLSFPTLDTRTFDSFDSGFYFIFRMPPFTLAFCYVVAIISYAYYLLHTYYSHVIPVCLCFATCLTAPSELRESG